MNYYIKGNKEKADQIKAAFERIGYNTSFVQKLSASDDHILFTLPCDYRVHAFHTAYIEADILKRLVSIDPDYKELELPVEHKFKVGDKVIYGGKERTITFMDDTFYDFDGGCAGCRIELQDGLLRPAPSPHYDIANFKPFDKVLVRCSNDEEWMIEFYCKYDKLVHTSPHRDYPFMGIGDSYSQCIPFNDDTKHLLGTTDMCDEIFINW